MKRLLLLGLPVLVVGLAACRRSSEAPAPTPAPETSASAPQAAGAPPSAVPQPGTLAASSTPLPDGNTSTPVKPVPAVLPSVIARVNGEEVQRWEVETTLKQAEANAGGPVPMDKRDAVIRGIIDELVTYHMLAQEARARNIAVPEAEVDTEMTTIRNSFPTAEAYQQALLMQGVTPDQLRQVTRLGMQTRKIIDAEVTAKVAVQDAEVDAFYNQNLERFKQGDTVRVSHIYFAVLPDATPAQKNQSRAAAQDTLKQLKAGGDFGKLAQERSNDATSANGGEMGFIEKGQVPADFEKIAFSMKPGTVSDVVELETGFHILKVHERRGPRTAPLAEVRDGLKQYLVDTQRQTKLDQFVAQLKTKSKIEILL
jgi:peptidyl-prolyl cis-trans isomerase C